MSLAGARVVVTGGGGLLGSHLCEALRAEGVKELIVLDNFVRGRRQNLDALSSSGGLRVVDGSVNDPAVVSRLMDGADYVAHLAALRVTRCEEDPTACFEVMLRGTQVVLEAAARAKVRKVLYASSVVVYGQPVREPMDETHALNTETFYGAAKVAGEFLCRAWRRNAELPSVVLRYFNMYGPRMSLEGAETEVLIKWLDKLEAGEAPVVHGDGSAVIDWVHVRDAARASVLALDSAVDGEVLNIASGRGTTLKELLELLIKLTGARVTPRFEPPRGVYAGAKRVGSPERAQRLLGFSTQVGLRDGLEELIEWYRQEKRSPARR